MTQTDAFTEALNAAIVAEPCMRQLEHYETYRLQIWDPSWPNSAGRWQLEIDGNEYRSYKRSKGWHPVITKTFANAEMLRTFLLMYTPPIPLAPNDLQDGIAKVYFNRVGERL